MINRTIIRNRIVLPALCVMAAIGAISPLSRLQADTVAVSFTDGTVFSNPGTLGYSFSVQAPLSVTELGFYDIFADGLLAAIPVTIWNASGTVQVNATVPAGSVGTYLNGFRYISLVTPVVLAPGTYTIGGYKIYPGDDSAEEATIATARGVTFLGSRSTGTNAYPSGDIYNDPNSYLGPNFQFNAVPEPRSWALLGAGVTGLGLALRRRVTRA